MMKISTLSTCDQDADVSLVFASADDAFRFVDVVSLIGSHLNGPLLITGSFAVEWNILSSGGRAKRRALNDIDVVVAGPEAILPGISERFLVNHFHPTREKGNVLLQLVEPRSRTRVDVFSARSETIAERGGEIRILGQDRLVVSAEDLAARLLGIVAIVLDGKTVDPKYADSLERLLEIVDRDSVDRLWLEYRWGRYNEDFWTTADRVKEAIGACDSLLRPIEYSQDLDLECSWCVGSEDLPRADVKEIHRLLGYV